MNYFSSNRIWQTFEAESYETANYLQSINEDDEAAELVQGLTKINSIWDSLNQSDINDLFLELSRLKRRLGLGPINLKRY